MKYKNTAVIRFTPNNLGRVYIAPTLKRDVNGNIVEFSPEFKIDTGSDFTILCIKDLQGLGYTAESLAECSVFENQATAVAEENKITLKYIDNISMELDCITFKNRRVFFAEGITRNLLGSDILKYFNIEIDREINLCKLRLTKDTINSIDVGLETDICLLEDDNNDAPAELSVSDNNNDDYFNNGFPQ